MSFLSPAVEDELIAAIAASESDRLLIAYDPETATVAGVWVEVHPGQPPLMRAWKTSGPMARERAAAWSQELVSQIQESLRATAVRPVTIN